MKTSVLQGIYGGTKDHAQENQKELLEEMNPGGYWGNKSSMVKILNLSSCQSIDRTDRVRQRLSGYSHISSSLLINGG
jgi:hypothetical protein